MQANRKVTIRMNIVIALHIACSQMFIFGSILLFVRSRGNRSRRILGSVLLFSWFNAMWMLLSANPEHFAILHQIYLPSKFIIGGSLVLLMISFYIIELVRPGWIGWKNGLLISLPWIVATGGYFVGVRTSGETVLLLTGASDMMAHVHQFNVWFRFVLLLMFFFYLILSFGMLLRYRTFYERWCARNHANTERMDLSWVGYFGWGLLVITVLYCFVLFNVWQYSAVVHRLVYMVVFGYLIYKGMFHENPYSEDFFRETLNEERAEEANDILPSAPIPDETFEQLLPAYVEKLTYWLDTEKPYLRANLKLVDAAEVLYLNRTYLSRVFNEGMGGTFSQVVTNYRVQRARQLLLEEHQLTIEEVSSRCGFSSVVTFHTAFLRHEGVTPVKYRKEGKQGCRVL